MSAVIPLKSLSEVLFPGPDAHDSTLAVVIPSSKEGIERVGAAGSGRVSQGLLSMSRIPSHHRVSEVKRLPVPFPRTIDPVKKSSDSRNEGKPRKVAEIKRSIK